MKQNLDAAGLRDPGLRTAYAACETFLRRRNSAAYPAARSLLPPGRRPYWDAILAFTTYVDDLLDDPAVPVEERAASYDGYTRRFRLRAEGREPWPDPPDEGALLARAFADFTATWRIPGASVHLFLDTIRTDLHVTQYPTFDDLSRYITGVCVQGSQWGGVLFNPRDERAAAAAASAMSFGLQLTDYLDDLREDLADGRLYLPLEDLDRFGLCRAEVERAAETATMTPRLRELVRFQLHRARAYLDEAARWRPLVHPSMRELPRQYVALARAETDRIARDDYDVFHPSRRRRATAAVRAAAALGAARVRARASRLSHAVPVPPTATGERS
ncbi:squalene/phytoene synthase family protein [Actinomadura algeriensis]|uniref:Phytoene synthase n=1 Tax=Actinomadura algeriensis TaxID=1679523 RepID=A0ABR9K487_9ACTN|nr:squalene/phytoene synthase family protein [Actinomadura algeriensis]MBE1537650.1 phytoene synthase [Actinomadura algeriensis]